MLTHGIDLEEDFVYAEACSEGLSVDAVRLIRRVVSLKSHAQASGVCMCILRVRVLCSCVGTVSVTIC